MAFDGTHIHIADDCDDNVRMILPPSAGGEAPIVYTYTVSGLGIVLRGWRLMGHIYISRMFDDNVRMILPPSSNGQADIVYTYTVERIRYSLRGMTFDGTHIHINTIPTIMFG